MAARRFLYLFVFLFMLVFTGSAQRLDTARQAAGGLSSDTTFTTSPQNTAYEDDDFSWFLFFFAFGFFILCLICLGAGVVLAAVLCLFFFAFVSLGIVSASFVTGLRRKSFSSGFRVFLTLCSVAAGTGICIPCAFLINAFFHYGLSRGFLFMLGSLSGIVAGFILGQILFIMLRRILNYSKEKLRLS